MKKLKILFCPVHYVFDGHERGSEISWSFGVTNNICDQWPESVVVTGFNVESGTNYRVIELQKDKSIIDMGLFNSFKFSLQYGWVAARLKTRERFDIHHHVLPFAIGRTFNIAAFFSPRLPLVIGPVQSPLPYYADSLQDAKEVLTIMGRCMRVISRFVLSLIRPITHVLSISTLKRAEGIIAIDKHTKNILLNLGIEDQKITIIPPGIHITEYKSTPAEREKENDFTLLSVGALIERKGVDCLIMAFAKAYRKHKILRLEILGDGPKRAELVGLSKRLGIHHVVTFHGNVDHSKVSHYYANADVFVSATRYESFGQMYLEAMASSLPIITTNNLGSSSISEHYPTMILVNKDSPDELMEAIDMLVVNREQKSLLGRQAFTAVQYFDWKTSIIPKYVKLYEEVLSRS